MGNVVPQRVDHILYINAEGIHPVETTNEVVRPQTSSGFRWAESPSTLVLIILDTVKQRFGWKKTGNFLRDSCRAFATVRGFGSRDLSDHYPVKATIQL